MKFLYFISMLILAQSFRTRSWLKSGRWSDYRSLLLSSSFSSSVPDYNDVLFLSGLFPIYKPKGFSSSDMVAKIKWVLINELLARGGRKKDCPKVGHGGTLDPLAEGVLVLGIGQGTKQLQRYLDGHKGYIAQGQLGKATDTLDGGGKVVAEAATSHVSRELFLAQLATHFTPPSSDTPREIEQIPPMYSALKKDGKRLYELAREGIVVERPSRRVSIYKMEGTWLQSEEPLPCLPSFTLQMEVSGGFYVRSLISDLSGHLGTVGHMTALIRDRQGPFVLGDCLCEADWTYEKIAQQLEKSREKLLLMNIGGDGVGKGGRIAGARTGTVGRERKEVMIARDDIRIG